VAFLVGSAEILFSIKLIHCAAQSTYRATTVPAPHAIMPSAMAAQVRCTGQPSGTVSSTTRVIAKSAHTQPVVSPARERRWTKRANRLVAPPDEPHEWHQQAGCIQCRASLALHKRALL
jgi:hypothetical protein